MSKTAKPEALSAALDAIAELKGDERLIAKDFAAGESPVIKALDQMGEWRCAERALFRRKMLETYNIDGSRTKPKGRRPRKAKGAEGEASDG